MGASPVSIGVLDDGKVLGGIHWLPFCHREPPLRLTPERGCQCQMMAVYLILEQIGSLPDDECI